VRSWNDAGVKGDQLRDDLIAFRLAHPGTAEARRAADLLTQLPSPLDRLSASSISPQHRFPEQPRALVALLTPPGNRAAGVAFSPDGVTQAVGELGLIRFYDLSDVQLRAEELQGVGKNANALAFSPDARLLATGAGEPMLRLWTRGADKRPD